MPDDDLADVLRYPSGDVKAVPAGNGEGIVAAHDDEARKRVRITVVVLAVVVLTILGAASIAGQPFVGVAVAAVVLGAAAHRWPDADAMVPNVLETDVSISEARDRWDVTLVGFDEEDETADSSPTETANSSPTETADSSTTESTDPQAR